MSDLPPHSRPSQMESVMKSFPFALAFLTLATSAMAETPVLNVLTYDSFAADWGPGPAIAKGFEAAVNGHRLSRADLFDTTYTLVPGSDPKQFTTRSLAIAEAILPGLQDALLDDDRSLAFAVAVDRNGYLPVHNAAYSKPQRPGDPVWNAANARNKRIFDDRAGLSAARNVQPFLIQSYPREMGDGTTIMMKEIDVPITLFGQHWGGFRMAYKM